MSTDRTHRKRVAPGVYVRTRADGSEAYVVGWRDEEGRQRWLTVPGGQEDAVAVHERLVAQRNDARAAEYASKLEECRRQEEAADHQPVHGRINWWAFASFETPDERAAAVERTCKSRRMMIYRCTNPDALNWERYGARGITVCERWLGRDGRANFLRDMGPRPPGLSLDRIDNDGGYEPRNCKWSTPREQRLNQRPRGPNVVTKRGSNRPQKNPSRPSRYSAKEAA